jgi:hypothetical protein
MNTKYALIIIHFSYLTHFYAANPFYNDNTSIKGGFNTMSGQAFDHPESFHDTIIIL